ncbi:DUF4262 domain-containing protein [Actinomadura sp. 3N407]|uniref:DUF4262 domain-containing protein n=1 Tax=Actinomadura sp. 3N407 TaxID=3457423 RepID=UPI003FCDDD50
MTDELPARARFRARITQLIDQNGWAAVSIPGPAMIPRGATYTIGFADRGAVDVVVLGLAAEQASRLLGDIWLQIRDQGFRPADGDHMPPGIRAHDLLFREVHPELLDVPDLFSQAIYYYRHPVPFLQAVWPDADGRLPSEPACASLVRAVQPDLSLRPAQLGALPSGSW